ncbi:MAG: hypothetical protein ISS73_09435 [Pirellulales bacterium]|nr:hypothetical protein [Pirellulales bacterium]
MAAPSEAVPPTAELMIPDRASSDTADSALSPSQPADTLPPTGDLKDAFRDALRTDPEMRAILREEAELIMLQQLSGIPKPRYIPATDFAGPKGFEVYARKQNEGFPASLYLNGFMQVRWFEFARSVTSWTDSAGTLAPVNNINTFEINRFYITTEGFITDENIPYSISLFGTTDYGNNSAITPLGYVGYIFNDQLSMLAGVTFVAGTREWATSSRWVLGIDRSMANTYFRPSYSPGVEFSGNFLEKEITWRGGVWNSIDGSLSGVNRNGTSMAWAGIVTWEPWGNYGLGYSDMEGHDEPALRFGCSGVHALSQAIEATNGNNPEDTIVRLSDGTPIATPNALGPNSQVSQFRMQLVTVDAGWKYKGVGLNFEYYWRLLDDFVGTGSFNQQSLFDQGGLAYMSFCLVPRKYELYGRSSAVTGVYGTGQEYGGGFNWYLKKSRQSKLTFEALYYNRSPADNTLYPYRAGFSGTAIQTQMLVMW